MRVLITSHADSSYFFSMVPTAWALRASGHEVRVACQPALAPIAAETGLTVVPVGRDHLFTGFDMGAKEPQLLNPDYELSDKSLRSLTWEQLVENHVRLAFWWKPINESLMPDLLDFCQEWSPDLVLWEPRTFAGAVAAEVCGAAHMRFLPGLDLLAGLNREYERRAPKLEDAPRRGPIVTWLTSFAERHGAEFSDDLLYGRSTLTPVPEPLRRAPVGSPVLDVAHVPYGGHDVMPRWLRQAPAGQRVLVDWRAWGAGGPARGAAVLEAVLEGLREIDAEVVLVVPHEDGQPVREAPEGVLTVIPGTAYAVARECSLIVHTGGFDSVCTAAANGVPQLIVPEPAFVDGGPMARAVADASAGAVLPHEECDAAAVRDLVRHLLEDGEVAKGADRLRAHARSAPTPDLLVTALESFADPAGAAVP